MGYFKDKRVVVTGGASGIGYELCRQLVEAGAVVLLTDINAERAEAAASALGCIAAALDVTDKDAFVSCVQTFEKQSGSLDMLYNNAGMEVTGEAHHFEYDDWKKVIDVNVYGVVNGVHAVYSDMVRRGTGQIINIASIAGLYPSAGQVSYSTSKYAVVGLSHALRAEATRHGVKVNVVCPGIIKTAMRDNLSIKGIKDPDKALNMIPQGISVESCVVQLLKGVRKNESTIVITLMAKALWSMNRLNPDLSMWFGGRMVRMLEKI